MSTILMPVCIIPNKPNCNKLWSFDRKCFKPLRASFNTGLIHCSSQTTAEPCRHNSTPRRSGNYKPTLWDFDYVQSLKSEYYGERYLNRASELREQVTMMLDWVMEPVDQLEFIDDLQRLGVSYHFEDKIKQILTTIYNQKKIKNNGISKKSKDLYTTALEFRLLRQHGFNVPQDVFNCFKNEKGEFKSSIMNDIKGILELYEASYMLTEDEDTLEAAREFATSFLQNYLDRDNQDHGTIDDQNLSLMVSSALEVPLHWRIQRPNSRWFISAYEKRHDMNTVVLEFAKLDFNIVQAVHIEELRHVSRWWKRTDLAKQLPFARNRLVECYFWTIGGLFEPQYRHLRIMEAKANALITTIDDIYDVYGTLEELQLFTDAIQRWDIKAIEQLPDYMQLCYLALNNFINETAYDVLKDKGFVAIPYLRNSWTDLCNTYLQEAKWYFQGYTPTLEEYIENAWVSISTPVILSHIYFLAANPIEEDVVQCLYKYHDIVRWSSTVVRLIDDLGTSPAEMKRGDVSKSIQCYMNETGATEKDAQEYVRFMLREAWKKLNKERVAESPFPHSFVRRAVDHGRIAQYIYQHGDGHGISNPQIQFCISSLLFEPIT